MRISDWSSDVCSSDLQIQALVFARGHPRAVDGDQLAQRLQEVRGRKLGKGQTPGAPLHPPRILVGPEGVDRAVLVAIRLDALEDLLAVVQHRGRRVEGDGSDRKSTRLNSSH